MAAIFGRSARAASTAALSVYEAPREPIVPAANGPECVSP